MLLTSYRNRRAATIENNRLRVTVLQEGGHIAEMYHKAAGVNPLWIPPWTSLEPSLFDRLKPTEYGDGEDARLLAGIMGHNLCLDIFGVPSPEEAAAGLTPHGEGSVVPYELGGNAEALTARAHLPIAELNFERRLELKDDAVRVRETVESLARCDRPIAWTQHVTLGPPFLARGTTEFRASATRSRVFEGRFGVADYLQSGSDFDWPDAPRVDGGVADLRLFTAEERSSAYTAHLMDPRREDAFFVGYSPEFRLAFGCVWKRADFPWLGIWEENHSRTAAPWNQQTLARGMEFGVSPIPESRRAMIDRGRLFGVPTYRWLAARSQVTVEYWIVAARASAVPESLDRPV
ncbi:MAG TPA: hypothetical protein VGZ27_03430 [Vicinamibacterales bacterium]|jgi:hypothetical protein|nr:hypothetical protein [Vicinamibacterales bacterium]